MTAATATLSMPTLIVDAVDYLLVDIATGRHLPGDNVHAEQLAHEHGLSSLDAAEAIDAAWRLGIVSRSAVAGCATITWTPENAQVQFHRLARAMVTAVTVCGDRDPHGVDLIDGEQNRMGAVELFGLTTPCDVDLFLELARALLARRNSSLVDELVAPVAIFFSDAAQRVHGFDFAASALVRQELVCELVRSLIDGRVDDFAGRMADYVVALSVD